MHASTRRSVCRLLLVLAAAVASVIALGACGSSGSSGGGGASKGAGASEAKLAGSENLDCKDGNKGGRRTVGVGQDVISFAPPYTQDNGSLWADMNVYDQLVRLNPD